MPKQEKSQENSNKENDKKPKLSSLVWCYFMGLIFMAMGFGWLSDIKTQGYYIDGKHQVPVFGDDGLITVYVLIVSGFLILTYSFYLTLKSRNKSK